MRLDFGAFILFHQFLCPFDHRSSISSPCLIRPILHPDLECMLGNGCSMALNLNSGWKVELLPALFFFIKSLCELNTCTCILYPWPNLLQINFYRRVFWIENIQIWHCLLDISSKDERIFVKQFWLVKQPIPPETIKSPKMWINGTWNLV